MGKLPDSLSLKTLMQGPIPGDITLGEAKAALIYQWEAMGLIAALEAARPNIKPLVIRFVDEDRHDLPDTMPSDTFRALSDIKKAFLIIEIDEDDGGSKQPKQPIELVH